MRYLLVAIMICLSSVSYAGEYTITLTDTQEQVLSELKTMDKKQDIGNEEYLNSKINQSLDAFVSSKLLKYRLATTNTKPLSEKYTEMKSLESEIALAAVTSGTITK